jgi:hypothetical protein
VLRQNDLQVVLTENPPTAKNADSKGRLTLGDSFANQTVLIEQHGEGEVLVKLARVIPAREAWLFDNAAALGSVPRGRSYGSIPSRPLKALLDQSGAPRGRGSRCPAGAPDL